MSVGSDEQSVPRRGVDRRTMLKTAAALGAGAVVWSAPHIETLGFAPAGATGTPCDILSPVSQDKNSNTGTSYCSATVGTFPCCPDGHNFGNNGGAWDEWRFVNPTVGCQEVVVRLVPLDCATTWPGGNTANPKDPNLAKMGVVISSTTGTCSCTIKEGVLIDSRQGRVEKDQMNNGAMACDATGVDISLACNDPALLAAGKDARLAVRISCQSIDGNCTVAT